MGAKHSWVVKLAMKLVMKHAKAILRSISKMYFYITYSMKVATTKYAIREFN